MSVSGLVSAIKDVFGAEPNYRPYSIKSTEILIGLPPFPVIGLQYVFARHNATQKRLIMGLSGQGVHVANRNQSGVIELGILQGSVTGAGIQVIELTGIPYPIAMVDTDTGGTSSVLAVDCQRVGTPEWRREALPGIDVYTFDTPALILSDGLRLVE